MVKIFFGNRSGVLLIIPVIVACFVLCNTFTGYHSMQGDAQFGFWGNLIPEWSLFSQLGAPILVVISAIIINLIFNRNAFFERNNFLPALLYVVGMSFFYGFYYLTGYSVATIFVVLALLQLYRLDQNADGRRTVFNAAFLLGVGTTFYPFLIVVLPFMFWMIWVLRPFVFRESALAVIGFIIPMIYGGLYSSFFHVRLEGNAFSSASSEWLFPDLYVVGGAIFLLLLVALGPLVNKLGKSSIRFKKLFRLNYLFIIFVLVLGALEFLFFLKIQPISLLLIMLVLILPYGFGDKNLRPFPTAVFYLMLVFAVGKFFVPLDF